MPDGIRTPFLYLAVFFLTLTVLVELGSPWLAYVPAGSVASTDVTIGDPAQRAELDQQLGAARGQAGDAPPGFAISTMAFVDGLLLMTVGLMALSIVIGDRLHARAQGIIGLVVAVLILLATLQKLLVLIVELMIRVVLVLAVPFGTIAYLALYGSFDRSGAAVILALILFLKLAAGACMLLAHQRFARQIGLLLMFATSFLCSIIVAFLHNLVPRPLVSITDALGAIVLDIVALIWALVFAIFGIIAVVKAIGFAKRQQSE